MTPEEAAEALANTRRNIRADDDTADQETRRKARGYAHSRARSALATRYRDEYQTIVKAAYAEYFKEHK